MAIELRCNVFQLVSPAGERRPALADIADRFQHAQAGMRFLTDGQIELIAAVGPKRLELVYKDPVPDGGEKDLHRAVERNARFATLRSGVGFGVVHVHYVTALAVTRNPDNSNLSYTQGYGDFPFILIAEGQHSAIARMALVHEFGHILLGPGHTKAAGNLMSEGGQGYATLTPDQSERMRRNAARIAAGGRPHYPLFR
jgi:hypothetical protein